MENKPLSSWKIPNSAALVFLVCSETKHDLKIRIEKSTLRSNKHLNFSVHISKLHRK